MNKSKKRVNPYPQKKTISRLDWRKFLGKIGESYVVDWLSNKGWKIIERNWRAGRFAEIDIIAVDPEKILVFIEVKTRIKTVYESGFIESGFDKLDKRKIQKLVSVARLYTVKCLGKYSRDEPGCRFDAFVLYYPAAVRQMEWESSDAANKLILIKPEVMHIKDLLS